MQIHGSNPNFPVSAGDESAWVWEIMKGVKAIIISFHSSTWNVFSPEWVDHNLSNIKAFDDVKTHGQSPTFLFLSFVIYLPPYKLPGMENTDVEHYLDIQ